MRKDTRDSPNQSREMGKRFSEMGVPEILRMYRDWARNSIPEKGLFSSKEPLKGGGGPNEICNLNRWLQLCWENATE